MEVPTTLADATLQFTARDCGVGTRAAPPPPYAGAPTWCRRRRQMWHLVDSAEHVTSHRLGAGGDLTAPCTMGSRPGWKQVCVRPAHGGSGPAPCSPMPARPASHECAPACHIILPPTQSPRPRPYSRSSHTVHHGGAGTDTTLNERAHTRPPGTRSGIRGRAICGRAHPWPRAPPLCRARCQRQPPPFHTAHKPQGPLGGQPRTDLFGLRPVGVGLSASAGMGLAGTREATAGARGWGGRGGVGWAGWHADGRVGPRWARQ